MYNTYVYNPKSLLVVEVGQTCSHQCLNEKLLYNCITGPFTKSIKHCTSASEVNLSLTQ